MPYRPIADADTFRRVVVLGKTQECRSLEFKAEYRWQKGKHKPEDLADQAEELCRDVAQFANGDGGTLVVGVTERGTQDGRKVADAIRPVENIKTSMVSSSGRSRQSGTT
jgi:hypothetical protein